MMQYEWRVSLLDGVESLRLSGQGIWLRGEIMPWSALSDMAFVRYQTRAGVNEEFTLSFGPGDRRKMRWMGNARNRKDWRTMLVAFAELGARKRPDLSLRDGPDEQETRVARWIGLGIALVALAIMGVVFFEAENFLGFLAGGWIGIGGSVVGGLIYGYYYRREPPPRIDLVTFAAREGQDGELPAN